MPHHPARPRVGVCDSPAPALAKLSSVRCLFIAYGFGREGQGGNITYKKPSLDGFFADLTTAAPLLPIPDSPSSPRLCIWGSPTWVCL
jgi:hypothetical protein